MTRPLALLFRLVWPEKRLLASFSAASLGRAGLTAASVLLIREFLSGALGGRGGVAGRIAAAYGVSAALWAVAGLLVLVYVGASVLTYQTQVTQQRIVKVLELGTMERLIRQLLGLSAGFFDRHTQGDLLQAVRQDVSELRTVGLGGAKIALELMQAAGLVVVAIWLSPSLALWAFLLIPAATVPVYLAARRTLVRSFGVRRKGVALFDVILQLLRGIRVIKIYQGEEAETERTTQHARQYFDELIAMERGRALGRVMLESLGGLSLVVVIIVGGFQVVSGVVGWPELLAFLMAVRAAHGPLNNVNTSYLDIQRSGAAVERIGRLLEERPEVQDRPDAKPLRSAPATIAARGLNFGFNQVPVLKDISFDIRAGQILGIVGPSGAGKSTLLSLLARFYDPGSGAVLFDGEDIRAYRLRDVYDKLAIVTQDPILFATSVRENIRCGRRSASDSEVEAAARAAEIHDDIVAMPGGYDSLLGTGGRVLSRGEAQRVNIARAILKNAPILLLDEATSSLDSYSEAKVQCAIDRLATGRTVISVAHRLSTLRDASAVLVLENGRAVGLGAHDQLLERCPTYRRLWEAQLSGAPSGSPPPQTAPVDPAESAASNKL